MYFRKRLKAGILRLVPVHKRTFFGGLEGQRVGGLSAGARRLRVEVVVEIAGTV